MRSQSLTTPYPELPLARKPEPQPVSNDTVFKQRSFLDAIRLAVNVSGLEEKEIYLSLEIDAGHWTRIMKGEAHFPVNKLNQFCDLVGSEIPLQWWANSRGKGLHLLETETERLLKSEQAARAKAEDENRLLRELIQGRSK